jgi:hypothetical protein
MNETIYKIAREAQRHEMLAAHYFNAMWASAEQRQHEYAMYYHFMALFHDGELRELIGNPDVWSVWSCLSQGRMPK